MTTQHTKIARGSEQRYWLSLITSPEGCHSPIRHLKGRAKNFASRYDASFRHLCARLRATGYTIDFAPGPRGGEWGGRYFAKAS